MDSLLRDVQSCEQKRGMPNQSFVCRLRPFWRRPGAIWLVKQEVPKRQFPHSILKLKQTRTPNIDPFTQKDLQRRRAVSPLKIKFTSKKSRQASLRGGISSGAKWLICISS
jgi:hypothetical protein